MFAFAYVCVVLNCVCVLCVIYRVELCALLFIFEFGVVVWLMCALACDGVWCVCVCMCYCVVFVRVVLVCWNMFVCFVWDVVCDDVWFAFVVALVCFV